MIHFMFSCVVIVLFLALFAPLIGNLLKLTKFFMPLIWPPVLILVLTFIAAKYYILTFY